MSDVSSIKLGKLKTDSDIMSEPPLLHALKPTLIEDSISSLLDITNTPQEKAKIENSTIAKSCSSVVDATKHGSGNSTFGSRLLTDPSKVDDFNAWDHVEWDESHLESAAAKVAFQLANPVPEIDRAKFDDDSANDHWNKFYENHEEGFFKDRKWIKLEFPELIACTDAEAGPKVIADLGCAVGNTVYPLLRINRNPQLKIHALDFSSEAIKVLKQAQDFDTSVVNADVWDIADPLGPHHSIADDSVDIIVLIFAFSALSPKQWPIAMANLHRMLKPGGLCLIRDYGRYDLTQLRLKANRLLEESFYIRGDGTRVYYFTNEEMAALFTINSGWALEQNAIDKRLLVNRKEGKKMYRAWVQIKARKT